MRLEFERETHSYRINGQRVPSVTEVLEPLNDWGGAPRETIQMAAAFGRHVHEACHLFNRGELDYGKLDPALRPYVDSWAAFLEVSGAVVIASELQVGHPLYGYAGTLDLIAELKAHSGRALIDIKSTATVPRVVGPQTAAYREAYTGGKRRLAPKRYCAHLQKDGSPAKLHALSDPADFSIFLSALNLWKWRQKHAA